MPETMSPERRKLIRIRRQSWFWHRVCGNALLEKARQLQREIPGAGLAGQFENPCNPRAHFRTTGAWSFADKQAGRLDILVGGGHRRHHHRRGPVISKQQNYKIKLVAVEPCRLSPSWSGGAPGLTASG